MYSKRNALTLLMVVLLILALVLCGCTAPQMPTTPSDPTPSQTEHDWTGSPWETVPA